mmetsp:Transcript_15561/g.15693  ORF Transcript_15561/g.15693 Transcript_15561/m.15693 type:complete len:95 (-) Transcript_15561:447-731(-)
MSSRLTGLSPGDLLTGSSSTSTPSASPSPSVPVPAPSLSLSLSPAPSPDQTPPHTPKALPRSPSETAPRSRLLRVRAVTCCGTPGRSEWTALGP